MVKDVLYNDEDVQSDTLLCQSEQFFYIDFIFLLHWTILGYFVKKEIAPLVEPSIESWEATHLGAPLEHLHQIENKWPPFPITRDKGDWMQKKKKKKKSLDSLSNPLSLNFLLNWENQPLNPSKIGEQPTIFLNSLSSFPSLTYWAPRACRCRAMPIGRASYHAMPCPALDRQLMPQVHACRWATTTLCRREMGERKERRKKRNCFASDMWVPHI